MKRTQTGIEEDNSRKKRSLSFNKLVKAFSQRLSMLSSTGSMNSSQEEIEYNDKLMQQIAIKELEYLEPKILIKYASKFFKAED